jgi:apolipoprotein D and lipocalin family protein
VRLKAVCRRVVVLGLSAIVVSAAGCGVWPPPEAAENIDLERYAGLWYEIARYPVPYQFGLVGVTATYTLNDDGTVGVVNRGHIGVLGGPEVTIEGSARSTNPPDNSKLLVSFDQPILQLFEAPYWILEVDEDYTYAIVGDPNRTILYILSRTPQMDEGLYDELLNRAREFGYEPLFLKRTPQPEE